MLTKLKRWTYINPVEDNVTEKSSGKGDSPLKPPWRGLRLYKLQPKRFMQACVYYKDTKHRSIDVLRSLEWMRSVKYFMRKDCALITPEQDIAQMGVGANKVSSMQSKTSHVKKKNRYTPQECQRLMWHVQLLSFKEFNPQHCWTKERAIPMHLPCF